MALLTLCWMRLALSTPRLTWRSSAPRHSPLTPRPPSQTDVPLDGTAELTLITAADLATLIPLEGEALLSLIAVGVLYEPITQFHDVTVRITARGALSPSLDGMAAGAPTAADPVVRVSTGVADAARAAGGACARSEDHRSDVSTDAGLEETCHEPMSDYTENLLRRYLFRTLSSPGISKTRWISLHTADPTDAGTGTEVSGGSYVRSPARCPGRELVGRHRDGRITSNVAVVTFQRQQRPGAR